jgi:uncharacterized protein (DUF427 family)
MMAEQRLNRRRNDEPEAIEIENEAATVQAGENGETQADSASEDDDD